MVKQSYDDEFDCDVFTGVAELPKRWRDGRFATGPRGQVILQKRPHEKTVPSYQFTEKYDLNLNAHPVEWFDAFVPSRNGRHGTANGFTLENMLSWTNTKARMQNSGLGGKYDDFQDFMLEELRQHIGLYLFQGLSPSPQVEMKFQSTLVDPVNGRDFIHCAFRGFPEKAVRRHKHFK